MERHDIPDDVLDRWLSGTATPGDDATVSAWIAEDSIRRDEVESLRAAVTETMAWTPVNLTRVAEVKALASAQHQSVPSTPFRSQINRPMHSARFWSSRAMVAFGAVALAMAGIGTYIAHSSARTPSVLYYETRTGQVMQLSLGHGTSVTLAPASKLTIRAHEATLTGEAVFAVEHAAAAPFSVRTYNTTVRVLGTTFGVRAYQTDSATRVVVSQGKVAVNHLVLSDRDVISISNTAAGHDTVWHASDAESLLSWAHGALRFNDTPLADVAQQLSRWYSIDFVIRDSTLARMPLTATVLTSDPIDSVMKVISITTGTTVRHAGRTVLIARARTPLNTSELAPAPGYATMSRRIR